MSPSCYSIKMCICLSARSYNVSPHTVFNYQVTKYTTLERYWLIVLKLRDMQNPKPLNCHPRNNVVIMHSHYECLSRQSVRRSKRVQIRDYIPRDSFYSLHFEPNARLIVVNLTYTGFCARVLRAGYLNINTQSCVGVFTIVKGF